MVGQVLHIIGLQATAAHRYSSARHTTSAFESCAGCRSIAEARQGSKNYSWPSMSVGHFGLRRASVQHNVALVGVRHLRDALVC